MKRVILPLLVLFGLSMLFALESEPSDVVGYIQYTISSNDFDFVAIPFETDMVFASDLNTNIGAGLESISEWSGGAWTQWIVGMPFGDFAIYEGHSYFVSSTSGTDITYYANGVVGDPASFDIAANDFTQIMLPLDCSDLATASALGADIGAGVVSISKYDAGAFVQYIMGMPFGDFNVAIGDGLMIDSTEAYLGWNSSSVRNVVRVQTNNGGATKNIKE